MVEVSVVVCTRNEEREIGGCLKAISAQELRPEIIVVDGHSTDKTVKIAKGLADKVVFDNKAGIGDARNIGAKVASGKIVAYCDADCRPLPTWTAKMTEIIDENTVAASGPLVALDGGFKQRFGFRLWADIVPRMLARLGYHCFWGANMVIKRETLLANPFKNMFIEDYELGGRLRKQKVVRFCKELAMPASTRRFTKSFYRTCMKHYVRSAFLLKLGKVSRGYFEHMKI